jgi:hypothetical protein
LVDPIRLSEAIRESGLVYEDLASQSYPIEKASQLRGKQHKGIAEHRRLAERHEVLPCGFGLEFQPSMRTTASESRTAVTPNKAIMKWRTIEYRFHLSSKGGGDSPVIQV